MAAREKELAALAPEREAKALAELEKSAWRMLQPLALKAEHQSLAPQEDRSILAGGPNPKNDTYTITFEIDLEQITALRLEALRHPTMTHGGIARSDSGNFVLTEIEVAAAALPEGVTAHPVKSLGTGPTAKAVTLRLSSPEGPLSIPFSVHGKGQSSAETIVRQAQFAIPGSNKTTPRLWLTITRQQGKK